MADALAAPVDLIRPAVAAPGQAKTREQIAAAAHKFESQFLSIMMGEMFKGVQVSAPFGGGEGEQAFRSFMMDAMAEQTAKRGGIGLAQPIMREMLKLQGLSEA